MDKLTTVIAEMEREFQRLKDENSILQGRIEDIKAALRDPPPSMLATESVPEEKVNGTPAHSKRKGGRGRPGVPAEKVTAMKAMRAKGLAVARIAKQLGVTPITVYKYTKA